MKVITDGQKNGINMAKSHDNYLLGHSKEQVLGSKRKISDKSDLRQPVEWEEVCKSSIW